MHLSSIHLRQYRSYDDVVFDFPADTTMIVGKNGTGKTNLLEAIYVLLTGRSFRDSDYDLTQHEKSWWTITGIVDGVEREIRYQDDRKQYRIGDTWYKRIPQSFALPVVLFEPDHLALIHGSPKKRRDYIDNLITQLSPQFRSVITRYDRILSQRNRLLKNKTIEDQLFIWDMQLAAAASSVVSERRKIINIWNKNLSHEYTTIADKKNDISVVYYSSIDQDNYQQDIIKKLHQSRERDRLLGITSVGVHRDDYEFFINNHSFITTASRGEVRSLVLGLKNIEMADKAHYFRQSPILLLDDVLSEIDDMRRDNIIQTNPTIQTIITTTHNIDSHHTIVIT